MRFVRFAPSVAAARATDARVFDLALAVVDTGGDGTSVAPSLASVAHDVDGALRVFGEGAPLAVLDEIRAASSSDTPDGGTLCDIDDGVLLCIAPLTAGVGTIDVSASPAIVIVIGIAKDSLPTVHTSQYSRCHVPRAPLL